MGKTGDLVSVLMMTALLGLAVGLAGCSGFWMGGIQTQESSQGDGRSAAAVTAASPAPNPLTPSGAGVPNVHSELLAGLKNQGAAAELTNEVWLNSEPLRLANLRGKVVLVDFWTFG